MAFGGADLASRSAAPSCRMAAPAGKQPSEVGIPIGLGALLQHRDGTIRPAAAERSADARSPAAPGRLAVLDARRRRLHPGPVGPTPRGNRASRSPGPAVTGEDQRSRVNHCPTLAGSSTTTGHPRRPRLRRVVMSTRHTSASAHSAARRQYGGHDRRDPERSQALILGAYHQAERVRAFRGRGRRRSRRRACTFPAFNATHQATTERST